MSGGDAKKGGPHTSTAIPTSKKKQRWEAVSHATILQWLIEIKTFFFLNIHFHKHQLWSEKSA